MCEVAFTWRENRNTPGILVWRSDENRSLGSYMIRLEDNIKRDV
jgi:hypothetical protein